MLTYVGKVLDVGGVIYEGFLEEWMEGCRWMNVQDIFFRAAD